MMPYAVAGRRFNAFTWVLAAWMLVFAITSIRVLVSKPRTHSDYLTFANTARNWIAGKGIYRQTGADGYYDDFRYSPIVAVALTPFSVLPDRMGNVLWRFVNLAAFLAALVWWGRKMMPTSSTPSPLMGEGWGGGDAPEADPPHPNPPPPGGRELGRLLALLFLLVLPLSIGNINNGQSNPLVLGLMLGAVAAVTERRWNLVSVLLAFAILFKIYPIAIALLLVALYPRQLAARLIVAVAVGLALPFLFQRTEYVLDQYQIWFQYLKNEDRQMLPLAATYRDVRLLFRAIGEPLSPERYMVVQLITAAGAAFVCLVGKFFRWSETRLLTLLTGLGCCWMTVFGVATESCTYMLVAPTGAWALMQAFITPTPTLPHQGRGMLVRGLLAGSFALFLIAQMANWFKGSADFHALGIQPFAGMLLIAGLLVAELPKQNPPQVS